MPTNDPLMPYNVRRAKYIRYIISERVDLAEGEDAKAKGFFNEDDDDDRRPLPISETILGGVKNEQLDPEPLSTQRSPKLTLSSANDILQVAQPRPLVHHRSGGRQNQDDVVQLFLSLHCHFM